MRDIAPIHGGERVMATGGVRVLIAGMRLALLLGSALVFLAGVQLFVLSEETDRWFAWTIAPPMTAAFLGAFYWTALVLAWLSARERVWANARVGVVGVLVFVSLTLLTTLLHLDRFHFDSDQTSARVAAWAWLAIYVLDPLVVAVMLWLQLRAPGHDPPRGAGAPDWLRALMAAQGAVVAVAGVALFVAPEQADALWPWPLSPLTARACASWLIGMGIILGQATWERDWRRIRAGLYAVIALGVLQSAALARYPDSVNWSSPTAWGWLLVLMSLAISGVAGVVLARPAAS